jgi:hypothetical protein
MHRLAVAVSVLFAVNALAQNVASDPQALAVAQKSLVALTGGARIGDVTLTGSVELDRLAGNGRRKARMRSRSLRKIARPMPRGSSRH